MAADALSIIPGAVLRNLSDKLYEKRKNAALEIEGIVKQLPMASEHEKISAVKSLLPTISPTRCEPSEGWVDWALQQLLSDTRKEMACQEEEEGIFTNGS